MENAYAKVFKFEVYFINGGKNENVRKSVHDGCFCNAAMGL
jgi:hypothetical protein